METILGLDLGTNSVGWAILTGGDDGAPPSRMDAGVYVFPDAGKLDSGLFVSKRLKRGNTRRQRKQLRRKRQRMRDVLDLLVSHGLLPQDPAEREQYMSRDRKGGERPYHPFALRMKGLDAELTLWEFGRCLHHIARRRGYFSTRDLMRRDMETRLGWRPTKVAELADEPAGAEKADPETSVLLKRLREVRDRIQNGEARTVGEFCARRLADPDTFPCGVRAGGQRAKGRTSKRDALGWRADRLMHEDEFNRLWGVQARFHPDVLTPRLRSELWKAIFRQLPLASKRGLIGPCEFFPKRRRLPRAALLAQRCSILQTLNNMRIVEPGGSEHPLCAQEVCALADALDRSKHLTWPQAKELIGKPDARFTDEPATAIRGKQKATRGHDGLRGNATAAAMRDAIGARWDGLCHEQQEELVDRLLYCRYPADVARGLMRDFGLTGDEVRALALATLPSGYLSHCTRVWRTLEPLMRQGLNYSDACVSAGYRAPGESTVAKPEVVLDRLGGLPDLRSPRVQRATRMAFRVINAVIDKYGKPDRIRIEMPRDVSMTNEQRERMYQQQDRNARETAAAAKLLQDGGFAPTEVNCRKVRLWQEAGGRCPYEPDEVLTLRQVVDECVIEHIVPRSRCWDDSWMNLTICPNGLNAAKGNSTPYEWLSGRKWERVRGYVNSQKQMPRVKRERLLRDKWEDDGFTNRALSDTRYLSVVVQREVAKLAIPVDVSRGQVTAMLRDAWDLGGCLPPTEEQRKKLDDWRKKPVKRTEKPRTDHRHHAIDAIVTALVDRRTLQHVTVWFQQRERGISRSALPRPKPWPMISADIRALMDRVLVVHAPTRTVSGAVNEATAKRPPARERVEQALAGLPPDPKNRVRRAVVVGTQLVYLTPTGNPLAAYDLGNNHHAIIWERVQPDKAGRHHREITVMSMLEAALRATARQPVIEKEREGWRYVMALCKNDVVEWVGADPGLLRVAAVSVSDGAFDIHLVPLCAAEKDLRCTRRVRGARDLRLIARRVVLSPLGDVLASEPANADH